MSEVRMYAELLTHTPDISSVVATAAKLCYSSADIDTLREKTESGEQAEFLKRLADMGHLSPLEHASFTFGIEGVSRALLAQITRHRIASFSVQSQRYVGQTKSSGELDYVVPPSVARLGAEARELYALEMQTIQEWYEKWVELLGADKKEDARFVLPNAAQTRMVVTMNARELMHFFSLRCCNRAQWEIRALAWAMLGHCVRIAPELFSGCGPDCVSSKCSEGGMSCGNIFKYREKHGRLLEFVREHACDADFAKQISEWAYDVIASDG